MIGGITLIPESPRLLFEKNRIYEAMDSLDKVNKLPKDHLSIAQEANLILVFIEESNLAGSAC